MNSIFNEIFLLCLALGSKLVIISLIGFLLLWLSKMKITSHVWFPTSERLAMIYKFVKSIYFEFNMLVFLLDCLFFHIMNQLLLNKIYYLINETEMTQK